MSNYYDSLTKKTIYFQIIHRMKPFPSCRDQNSNVSIQTVWLEGFASKYVKICIFYERIGIVWILPRSFDRNPVEQFQKEI